MIRVLYVKPLCEALDRIRQLQSTQKVHLLTQIEYPCSIAWGYWSTHNIFIDNHSVVGCMYCSAYHDAASSWRRQTRSDCSWAGRYHAAGIGTAQAGVVDVDSSERISVLPASPVRGFVRIGRSTSHHRSTLNDYGRLSRMPESEADMASSHDGACEYIRITCV